MKKSLFAVLLAVFASSSYAFDLPNLKVSDLLNGPAAAAPAPAPLKAVAASRQYKTVSMAFFSNPSWHEAEATDYSAGIQARVRKSGSFYNASLRAGNQYETVSLSRLGDRLSLSGSGINLTMQPWGSDYLVSGSVQGNGGGYTNVYARFSSDNYSGGRYFYISDQGLTLNFNPGGVNGSYEDGNYSPKAVAAVTALALAGHLESLPQQKAEQPQGEQIWLTYRNNPGAFTQIEASDPFANLQVNLRKVFNREYEAEVEAGAEREQARVSNFFSNRWEYTAGQTRLELEEWAGEYTLKGELYGYDLPFSGLPIALTVRPTFGPGSFNINAAGLRLGADKGGLRAWIDTKVYPKKLVAVIAAISMAMQQQAYNPNQPW